MANLASAKKRNRQNLRSQERNRARKSVVKTLTKKLLDAVHDGNKEAAQEAFTLVTKQIDQTAAKGTYHKNTASRKKSRLAKRLLTLGK